MKLNASKFAFFCLRLFFQIVIFQYLTADSNKIFLPPFDSRLRLYPKRTGPTLLRLAANTARPRSGQVQHIAQTSAFCNKPPARRTPLILKRCVRLWSSDRDWRPRRVALRRLDHRLVEGSGDEREPSCRGSTGVASSSSDQGAGPAVTDPTRESLRQAKR
jgi:hypothetical protein